MKLKDARENYYTLSASASQVNRQLAFAGIAIIWLFRVQGENEKIVFDGGLILPLFFIVTALACDFLQYVYGSAAWGVFHRIKEKKNRCEDGEIDAPCWINWPTILLFWMKILSTAVAYCLLLLFLRKVWLF